MVKTRHADQRYPLLAVVVLLAALSLGGCLTESGVNPGPTTTEDPNDFANPPCSPELIQSWPEFCASSDWNLTVENCIWPLTVFYYHETQSPLPPGWTPNNQVVNGLRQGIIDIMTCPSWLANGRDLGPGGIALYTEPINTATPVLVEVYPYYLVSDHPLLVEAFSLMGFDADFGEVVADATTGDSMYWSFKGSNDTARVDDIIFRPAVTGERVTMYTLGDPGEPTSYQFLIYATQGQPIPSLMTVEGTFLGNVVLAPVYAVTPNPYQLHQGTFTRQQSL